ncbi:hypothetical protein GGR42_002517 [Saonia flava]|uniref:DUF4386 domain-containing protein n=1 Tax=Saonia flava TaxID=523696 RepID=A0A846QST1_9FLAO|nr:DUF4386 domain-containing protein [Saonia flava]NJB72026.1 hypothetical protein [Saonia flava]
MQPKKNSGRILGFLFLVNMILGVIGISFRGLTGAEFDNTTFLSFAFENINQMKLAIYLDMASSAVIIGVAIFLFPFIRQYNGRLALAYFGIAIINFLIIAVSNILHIGLLSVCTDFVINNGTSVSQNYTTIAKMLYDSYYWTHFLTLILFSIGNSVLFYFFFKSRITPKWLAIWGILASVVVFFGGALQMAEIEVSFILFGQNGIFMVTLIIWLIIKGFKKLDITE